MVDRGGENEDGTGREIRFDECMGCLAAICLRWHGIGPMGTIRIGGRMERRVAWPLDSRSTLNGRSALGPIIHEGCRIHVITVVDVHRSSVTIAGVLTQATS